MTTYYRTTRSMSTSTATTYEDDYASSGQQAYRHLVKTTWCDTPPQDKWGRWDEMSLKELKNEYAKQPSKDLRWAIRERAVTIRAVLCMLTKGLMHVATCTYEAAVQDVEFHRRLCTPLVPATHWNCHNSPVRFVREGL